MTPDRTVLFICEKYFLRFYRPLADRLAQSGFQPVWVTLDGEDQWNYEWVDPNAAIETLVESPDLTCRADIDRLCVLERAVFERPSGFKSYPYTITVVRTNERARRLAEVWFRSTTALVRRFRPRAVFIWNGRYLPYRAISASCEAAGQPYFTSEIGWIPGTIFVDRGILSTSMGTLSGRTLEDVADADLPRADQFLADYTTHKATMVSQAMAPPSEVRCQLLGADGTFLLLYGCQVDWDTNVLIGARRFRSNAAAVSFLLECMAPLPGARLVVKTHPLDSDNQGDSLRELIGNRGTVTSNIHPHSLIEAADVVAVRNSTLGFEALCYEKPLILLEDAKYKHQSLTLDAPDVAAGSAGLMSIVNRTCRVPDRTVLRRFILHLVDQYLLPVPYRYYFKPDTLDILSHFTHNQSHQDLQQALDRVVPLTIGDSDDPVFRALDASELRRPEQSSFLRRQARRLSRWLTRGTTENARSV